MRDSCDQPSPDALSSNETRAECSFSKYCLHCGYVLDHLPEPRCPECGKAFDPTDAESYLQEDREIGGRYLKVAFLCLGLMVGGIVAAPLGTRLSSFQPVIEGVLEITAILVFLAGYALAIVCFFVSAFALRDPMARRANRTALWAAIVLSGAIVVVPAILVGIVAVDLFSFFF